MRIALYHRVSTLDQNPELCRGELRAAGARLGGEIVLDIEETGTGAKNDRPGLARVMDAARRGAVDVVCVWKLDRFGRSARDLLANIGELKDRGLRFVATTQGLDTAGGATAQMMLTILAAVAEFELELIRSRTLQGMKHAREKGTRSGLPIGRGRGKRLSAGVYLEPSTAVIDRAHAFRTLYRSGEPMSWRRVRGELEREGVRNLPDAATLARYVQKAYPSTPRGRRGWPRG
jgi:putative DNA-invertase from lambdoid prophage Rac